MNRLENERGVVMVVALGIVIALAAMSVTVARSGQMSTITGLLSAQVANAFYLADGAAYHALGDASLFHAGEPNQPAPVFPKSLSDEANMPSRAEVQFSTYRSLPGNLLIRTTDGRVRPGQFGQNEGLGKMYYFNIAGIKDPTNVGLDPASTVQMQAARPGPCADCGS